MARVSILVGTIFEMIGLAIALTFLFVALHVQNLLLAFFLCLISMAMLVFFPHCLAHYIVGRLVGVRFEYYRIGRSGIAKLNIPVVSSAANKLPVLTLKANRASLARLNSTRIWAMFSAGALASMILPYVAIAESVGRLPLFLTEFLILVATLNLLFDLFYSPRSGDLSRARSFSKPN